MKKRFTSLALVLVLLSGFLCWQPMTAQASPTSPVSTGSNLPANPATDFTFDPTTGTITAYVGTATDVVIPSHIEGQAVKAIGKQAFMRKNLTSLVLNEGLKVIGEGAFSGNTTLTNVTFCSSLERIEKGAFILVGAQTMELNQGLKYIGPMAFAKASNLTSINLPASLEEIGDQAFMGTSKLSGRFELGTQLGHVGHRVFYNGGSPVEITIASGEGAKLYLHDELLKDQASLAIPHHREIMVFARSFTSLPATLDAGRLTISRAMTPVEIESKIKETVRLTSGAACIDPTAPDHSKDIYLESQVDWPTENLDLSQDTIRLEGVFAEIPAAAFEGQSCATKEVVDAAMAQLKPVIELQLVDPEPVTDYEFDASTGTISKYLGSATDIVIPQTIDGVNVKTIGKQAFYMKGLTSLVLNEGLEIIGEGAFAGNPSLTSIQFSSSIRRIEKGAFIKAGAESLVLNEGLEYLGQYAFSMNANLTTINLPQSLTTIESNVFKGDAKLTGSFSLGNQLGHVQSNVFKDAGSPLDIQIASGQGNKLYLHCYLFPAEQTSLTIPQDRDIMLYAFTFGNNKDITMDAGSVEISRDMSPAEIEAKIKEKSD